jgi:DedD protein
MRFEIGPGGGFVVLAGLLGLSAAVFFLGMISGREMAQSEQGQSQLASVYPMPAGAPAAAPPQAVAAAVQPPPAPIATATPKSPSPAAIASRDTSENMSDTPAVASPKSPPYQHKAPPHPTLASVSPARPSAPAAEESDNGSFASPDASAPSDSSASSDDSDTGADEGTSSARPPSAVGIHHRGYNIVIDAAMDRAGANRMAARLLGLGYTSHILPTQINGQTWYRVQIGPYPSPDAARAAQAQLRAAYTARYVNREGASSPAAVRGSPTDAGGVSSGSSTDTDTSASGAADSGSDDSSGGGGGGGDSAPTD